MMCMRRDVCKLYSYARVNITTTCTAYTHVIHLCTCKHICKMYCVHARDTYMQYTNVRVNITEKMYCVNARHTCTQYMYTRVNITAKCTAYTHVIHLRTCKHNCNMYCVHTCHTCTQYLYARLNKCRMYCVHARHTCTQYMYACENITAKCTAYTHIIHVRNTCTHV